VIYQHLYFKGNFKVKIEDKCFIMRHNETSLENVTFWEGIENGWEKESMKLWSQLCKNSECVFDIGAHVGLYSLVAKTISPSSNVYAFEPVGRIYNKLLTNCNLNKFDILHECIAISNKDGFAHIKDTNGEALSLDCSLNYNEQYDNKDLIEIQTKTLKSLIEEYNIAKIDLMKIDVEGHEVSLLQGMGKYLQIMKPTMIIEIVDENNGSKVHEMIKGFGYLYFNIDEINQPRLVPVLTRSDKYNFLLCNENIAKQLNLI
jgi:FkbM family methyltransferase